MAPSPGGVRVPPLATAAIESVEFAMPTLIEEGFRRCLSAVALCGIVVASTVDASALDHPLSKASIRIKRTSTGDQKILFKATDADFPIPAIDSTDDPATLSGHGFVLQFFSFVNEEVGLLVVPPGLGNPGWSVFDEETDSFRFSNRAAPGGLAAAKLVVLDEGKGIKIVAKASGLDLDHAQGGLGVRIVTGTLRSCVRFSGDDILADAPGDFRARSASPGDLDECAAGILGGAVCGNGVAERHEACDGPADGRCPGACQSDCTCAVSSCGDNVLNDPAEECDGSAFEPGMENGLASCSPSCTLCSDSFCTITDCCTPGSRCLASPRGGQCIHNSCIPPYECEQGQECTAERTCCASAGSDVACSVASLPLVPCCGEATCSQPSVVFPVAMTCCYAAGESCADSNECCSLSCVEGACVP